MCVCVYNEIVLSHHKRWNTAMCNNMDGSSECHANQYKLDGKSQEAHDFYSCEIYKWKQQMKKQEKQTNKNS